MTKKDKCKIKGCKKHWMIKGYCCEHYLKKLNKFEKDSCKVNFTVG